MGIVDEIKDRLSLPDYIGREVSLQERGGKNRACCPFHSEKTPSFIVDDSHYHCFGCGAHGDIFTWVMARQNLDFREALRLLAREAGVELRDDAEAQKKREEHLSRVAVFRRVAEFYHSMLVPEAREYLHGRGFRDEFIDSYLIGFAPGDSLDKTGIPTSDLQRWGLANQDGRDTLYNRIVFPIYGRYDDEIIGFNGRAWPQVDRKPKYMAAPAGQAGLINERGLRGAKAVYLAEGDSDCATLVQAGLPVVGVRGTQGLKDEYKALFDKCETVYVCADADEPGLALMHSAGRLLGNKARIVMLPDGEDVNSWVGQKGNDIVALAEKASAYVDWLISRLPEQVAADQVEKHVKEFVPALKGLGKAAQDVYSKKLAKALGVTVAPIREELREAIAANGSGHGSKDALKDTGIIWDDRPTINPAQELIKGVMYTTVFLDTKTVDEDGNPKEEEVAYIVTSERQIALLTAEEMAKRGLKFSKSKVPLYSIVRQRWAIGQGKPHSVKNYVDGGVSVEPWAVYTEVRDYFLRYVDYPNPLYYDLLTLWCIGTYWFQLFESFPYIHLNGGKGSGKSVTLGIMKELAFNAQFSPSSSSASMFRTIEACSATFLMDEAENLFKSAKKGEDEPGNNDKLEILKSGYKRGGVAIRCAGDNHDPTGFSVYSPKMFGSIMAIDRVLADRTITIFLLKNVNHSKQDFISSEIDPQLWLTRDKLYCLMLEFGREIGERLTDADARVWAGVRGRDREIWGPLLLLASLFDDAFLEVHGTEGVKKEDLLLDKMRRLSAEITEEKLARDAADQSDVLILDGCLEFIKQQGPMAEDFWPCKDLLAYLRDKVEGLDWLKDVRQVYRELERMTVIRRQDDIKRLRSKMADVQIRCVRLNKVKIMTVAAGLGYKLESQNEE